MVAWSFFFSMSITEVQRQSQRTIDGMVTVCTFEYPISIPGRRYGITLLNTRAEFVNKHDLIVDHSDHIPEQCYNVNTGKPFQ